VKNGTGVLRQFVAKAARHSSRAAFGYLGAVLCTRKLDISLPVEARAGFLDRPTLVVLIVSTSLMIGVFAVLYIGFFGR
jgi:hypothetical protein